MTTRLEELLGLPNSNIVSHNKDNQEDYSWTNPRDLDYSWTNTRDLEFLMKLDKEILIIENIILKNGNDVDKTHIIKLLKKLEKLTKEKISLITDQTEKKKIENFIPELSKKIIKIESILNGMFKAKKFIVNKKVVSDPRNILHYLSEKGIRKKSNPKDIIKVARLWLDDDDYMLGVELWKDSKKWPIITEEELEKLISKAMTKKYMERDSPMFSASNLCGVVMKGNDKTFYKSVEQGKSCVWKKIEKSVKKSVKKLLKNN